MATTIQAIPVLSVAFVVSANEDWVDSIAFYYAGAVTPIPLTGIAFDMMVRRSPDAAIIVLSASTEPLLDGAVPDGTITVGGVLNNVWALNFTEVQVSEIQFVDGVFSADCVFDVVARADGIRRNVMSGTVHFNEGVTR